MSSAFSPGFPTLALDVSLRRCGRRLAVLLLALSGAAPALAASNIGIPAALTLALLALAAGACGLVRAGWLGGRRQITRIVWQADGRWLLTDARGRHHEAILRPDTRMSTSFIWLRWQLPNSPSRAPAMLLARGDAAADDLRRLRVRLKLDRRAGATYMRTAGQARAFTA